MGKHSKESDDSGTVRGPITDRVIRSGDRAATFPGRPADVEPDPAAGIPDGVDGQSLGGRGR
ncbi:MAG TPA: hypothetical protein VD864_11565 [Nocardioides sp.]|nr:hypothetical protein [Nocardioides sp.]